MVSSELGKELRKMFFRLVTRHEDSFFFFFAPRKNIFHMQMRVFNTSTIEQILALLLRMGNESYRLTCEFEAIDDLIGVKKNTLICLFSPINAYI